MQLNQLAALLLLFAYYNAQGSTLPHQNPVRNSTAAGGPSYHMATYDVLANSFQAIFGGWQVHSKPRTSYATASGVQSRSCIVLDAALSPHVSAQLCQVCWQPQPEVAAVASDLVQVTSYKFYSIPGLFRRA
jgi:hypothetical protein